MSTTTISIGGQKNYNLSLITVVLALCCCAALYFLYARFWPNYQQTNNSLTLAQQNNQKLTQTLSDIQTYLKTFDQQKQNAAMLNLALPAKSSDMANFVSNISQIADQSGITMTGFSIGESSGTTLSADNTIVTQAITITATGTFASLVAYINSLQENLRLVDLYHLGISTSEDKSLAFQISLRTYFQR